jgi:hypothetical protein
MESFQEQITCKLFCLFCQRFKIIPVMSRAPCGVIQTLLTTWNSPMHAQALSNYLLQLLYMSEAATFLATVV